MVVTSDVVEEKPYQEILDKTCPSCRRTIPWDAEVCPQCGYRMKGEAKPEVKPKPAAPKKKRKKGNVVAGVSVIILGLLAVGSYEYFPPATVIALIMIIAMISMAAAPAK